MGGLLLGHPHDPFGPAGDHVVVLSENRGQGQRALVARFECGLPKGCGRLVLGGWGLGEGARSAPAAARHRYAALPETVSVWLESRLTGGRVCA